MNSSMIAHLATPSVDALIADIDVEVNDVAGILNVQHARLVDVAIRLIDDDRLWVGQGMKSVAHWLTWRTGSSAATAAQPVAIAGRAADLPESLAAFRRGELSLDQISVIARKAPWWCDDQAREYGCSMTVQQLHIVLNDYPFPQLDDEGREVRTEPTDQLDDAGHEPSGDSSPATPDSGVVAGTNGTEPVLPDEWCSLVPTDDGMFRFAARLHPDTANLMHSTLDAARDRLFTSGQAEIALVDALRHVFETAQSAEPDPRRRARYATSMFIDASTGHMTDVAGLRVPDALRRQLTCDGTLTPVFTEGALPVSVGRSRYVVPNRTRNLIEHRDHGVCRVPGCDARWGLEVHHVIHWEHDGPTDSWNLVLICGHHHRMHHRGRLAINGNADQLDGIEFHNEHGRPITFSGAAPSPPTRPPPRPPEPYGHPDGGRLDKRFVYFQPPPAHIEELRKRSTSDSYYLRKLKPPAMN